ncbi:hypothetical protein D3C85_1257340 [compost metagenome]
MVLELLARVLEGEAADLSVAIEVREHKDATREEVTELIRGILARLDQTGSQSLLLGESGIPQGFVQATGEADIQPHQHLFGVATQSHQRLHIQASLIVACSQVKKFL